MRDEVGLPALGGAFQEPGRGPPGEGGGEVGAVLDGLVVRIDGGLEVAGVLERLAFGHRIDGRAVADLGDVPAPDLDGSTRRRRPR